MNPKPDAMPAELVAREKVDIPDALAEHLRARLMRVLTRKVLDSFWLDIGFCHYSAAMQNGAAHPLHRYYLDRAAENRERIERERLAEENWLARRLAS